MQRGQGYEIPDCGKACIMLSALYRGWEAMSGTIEIDDLYEGAKKIEENYGFL